MFEKRLEKVMEKDKDIYSELNNNKIINNYVNQGIMNDLREEDLIKVIMSQDIMEGFWNENEETKKLIKIITEDIFNKINNKIKEKNKGEEEIKIIYTILVIYYLETKQSEKIKDFRLIINKANKFLISHGIKYEDFISQIGL